MNIIVELKGTAPLLMHNPRMVDPNYEMNVRIKELTSKRKKTEADLRMIEELEWWGGIYTENVGGKEIIVQPSSKVRKCLVETARINKQGRQVERAVSFLHLNEPLIYRGPRDIQAVFGDKTYWSRLSVKVGTSRVMRVRPAFPEWGLVLPGIFIEDAGLNFSELERIVALSGQVSGIGDNRVNGYGRFVGSVREVDTWD